MARCNQRKNPATRRTRDDSEEEFTSRFARKKSSAGKIVLVVLGGGVVLVAGFFLWLHLAISSDLAEMVKKLNARCPIQIEGSPLQLRRASSVGKKVWLTFRMSGIRAGEVDWLESEISTDVRSAIRSNPDLAAMLRLGVEIKTEYRDLNDELIGTVDFDRSSI